jgi:hypothetical protein
MANCFPAFLDTLIEGMGADRGFVVVREAGEFCARR